MKRILVFFVAVMLFSATFYGCTPSQYTKGVDIDDEYPEDVLAIYDDAVVYECETRFDKVILYCGTKDDIEDIVEYFQDYYEYKNIFPYSEEIDDDTYSAVFTTEGYEFEVEIEDADGKYVEELFEYTIKITSKNLNEVDGEDTDTADTNDNAKDDQPIANATDEPVQKNPIAGETSLTELEKGAWYSYSVLEGDGTLSYVDYTIYLEDDSKGSYHYFDYGLGEKLDYEFTYNIVNGVLVLDLENNVQLLYDAYLNNNRLHLVNQYTNASIYMYNWNLESGKTPNLNEFTAYGDWILYSPDPLNIITLSFWDDGDGYVYNWNSDYSNDRMMWTENNNLVEFEVGKLYSSGNLQLHLRGNVLKITHPDGKVQYYNRVTEQMLAGMYEVTYTNDSDISKWEATLNIDGTSNHRVSLNRISVNYDKSDWYINPTDGMFYAYIFGEMGMFYYHFSINELNMYEPTESLEYTFDKTQ